MLTNKDICLFLELGVPLGLAHLQNTSYVMFELFLENIKWHSYSNHNKIFQNTFFFVPLEMKYSKCVPKKKEVIKINSNFHTNKQTRIKSTIHRTHCITKHNTEMIINRKKTLTVDDARAWLTLVSYLGFLTHDLIFFYTFRLKNVFYISYLRDGS